MLRRSAERIAVWLVCMLVLSLGLTACDTVDSGVDWVGSGAARGANWVSGTVGGDASTSPSPR